MKEAFMVVSASKLRQNIYKMLDQVLKTGVPIVIVWNGKILKIVPEQPVSKLGRLKKRKTYTGDPEDFVHMDWSHEWRP
jgi:hypothetical protein